MFVIHMLHYRQNIFFNLNVCRILCEGCIFFVFWNLRFQKEGSFGRGVPNKPWGKGSGGVLREGGPEQALGGGVWGSPSGGGSRTSPGGRGLEGSLREGGPE